ncbi:MAG: glycosyltransferase family 2 protein [Gammaproteobacteria bacterium]|nr:glycosyltransferase family 2 protein [Gammaproteobacteria bacterium]
MIALNDHDRHLFDPNPKALADRLTQVIQEGVQPAHCAWSEAEARDQWLGFISRLCEADNFEPSALVPDPQPMVSICLVHYNRPHLLTQALNSLRQQTYPNIEVVLVDDGSPGIDAQAYLDGLSLEFERRDWQIIRQKNSYLGTARNNAALVARGDYLLFMDDDNVALPEMVATFVYAAMNSGADVLTAVMMPFSSSAPPMRPERLWITLGGALGAGLYRNTFGDANALWRKSSFEQLGGYTTDYGVGHEDWELFADAVLSGLRIMLIPMPLYWYRVNPSGMLRAGDTQADHARSVRPFLRHDPNGLGMALAYALHLQRAHEASSGMNATNLVNGGRSLFSLQNIKKALRLAKNPSLRAQFIGSWRSQGLRIALKRALIKVSR